MVASLGAVARVFRGARGFMPKTRKPQARSARASGVRFLVPIGDTHVGSEHGLMTPELGYTLTDNQLFLYDCWLEFWRWVKDSVGRQPYDVLLNGDVIQGTKYLDGLQIPDFGLQCEAAAEIFAPIVERARRSGGRVFITNGTPVHDGDNFASLIGRIVGAEVGARRRYANPQWIKDYGEFRVIMRHHPAVKTAGIAGAYKEAKNEWDLFVSRRRAFPPPALIVTSHVHEAAYHRLDADLGGVLRLPAWQAPTAFAHKVVSGQCLHAQVGGALVRFERGRFPEVQPRPYTIPLPPIEQMMPMPQTATRASNRLAQSGKR